MSEVNDKWVILELSSKAEGEDPDIVRRSIAYAVRGAEVYIPAAITQMGEDRVVHYLVDGYAFIRHQHPEAAYTRLENSKYVANIVTKVVRPNGGRPIRQLAFVTSADIDRMKRQIHAETDQGISVGDTVVVTSGAYKHIQAKIIEEIQEEQKVQVHIQLRSKDTIISLPRSFLRLVERAPKAPSLDRFSSIKAWFNEHVEVQRQGVPALDPLVGKFTNYERLRQWSDSLSSFHVLSQSLGSEPTLEPIRSKAAILQRMMGWSSRFSEMSEVVRSFYVSLDLRPIKELGRTFSLLNKWADRWQQAFPFIRLSAPAPISPIESKFSKWFWLQGMQERLNSLISDVTKIEDQMKTKEDAVVQNVIVDGFNLAYRCFYAPGMGEMRDTQGRHTGVLFGFLRSLISLTKKFPGANLVVVWDGSNRTRRAKFDGYKANRNSGFSTEVDSSGAPWDQVAWLREVLPILGVRQAYNPSEEADDVIASLVRVRFAGQQNLIMSTDRDLLQLISDTVKVLMPAQGKRKEAIYDASALKDEWGVGADQMVMLRALLGDTSDNLPGVPTVPQKVLTGLVQMYGSIDGIYTSNLAGLTKHRYECLRSSETQVRLNLDLMTLRDVPITEVEPKPNQTIASERLTDVDVQVEPILRAFFGRSEAAPVIEQRTS